MTSLGDSYPIGICLSIEPGLKMAGENHLYLTGVLLAIVEREGDIICQSLRFFVIV